MHRVPQQAALKELGSLGTGALVAGGERQVHVGVSRRHRAGGRSPAGTINNIGFISPFTGSLAGLTSGDKSVIEKIRAVSAGSRGFTASGRKCTKVNKIVPNSRPDPDRAAQACAGQPARTAKL